MVNDEIKQEGSWQYISKEDGPDVVRIQMDQDTIYKAHFNHSNQTMIIVEPVMFPVPVVVKINEELGHEVKYDSIIENLMHLRTVGNLVPIQTTQWNTRVKASHDGDMCG